MFSRRSMADLMLSRLRGPTSGCEGKSEKIGNGSPQKRLETGAPGPATARQPLQPLNEQNTLRVKTGAHAWARRWSPRRRGGSDQQMQCFTQQQSEHHHPLCSLMDTEVEPQVPQPRVRDGSRWKSVGGRAGQVLLLSGGLRHMQAQSFGAARSRRASSGNMPPSNEVQAAATARQDNMTQKHGRPP